MHGSNPPQSWGKPEGTAVCLSLPASTDVNGRIIHVDRGSHAVL
jgi:hypothetical protein